MTESPARHLACDCVILSETGLETEAEPPSRARVAFDEATLRRLVAERLGPR